MKKYFLTIIAIIILLTGCSKIEGRSYTVHTNNEYSEENKADQKEKETSHVRKQLSSTPILQNPELPAGCEITSLTTVLNYYGFNVDKEYMAKEYLQCGKIGETDPNVAFIGTPYDKHSFGCYSPVIVTAANAYLEDNQSELKACDISGTDMEMLKEYIDNETPVIIWATINMLEPYESVSWKVGDKKVTWLANEHCLVLIGYDDESNTYITADPLKGIVEYDKEIISTRYNQLGKQSVILK